MSMNRTTITKLFLTLSMLLTASLWAGIHSAQAGGINAIYVLTNSPTDNGVAIFTHTSRGVLTAAGTVSTGGLGTGSELGSQGALAMSSNLNWLLAVNPGSNEISAFTISQSGLTLTNKLPSGGTRPISVACNGTVVYVLNAGGSGNITGFRIDGHGRLTMIPNSTRPLSSNAADPAQVQFSPNGSLLMVTEKATNVIDTYTVDQIGVATGPRVQPAAGTTPFGLAFNDRGQLVVSEAFGGASLGSAASSYTFSNDGTLRVVSGSVATHQTASNWTVLPKYARYAYTINSGSGSITGYRFADNGSLTLLNADGRTAMTGDGSAPIDATFTGNGQYLYVLMSGAHGIAAFAVQRDGSLVPMAGMSGLPAGAVGIAGH